MFQRLGASENVRGLCRDRQTMHIPDGYLSPSTCAALYAGSAPFWWVALRKVRRQLHTRLIPLVSLFAAFSFVIMMFNLPLPGGTTGHAVGVAVAAIVLGPWASVLAISVALLVQAVFFGDGGVTTFGANCFNLAIVGSFTAAAVYRAASVGASQDSMRRVVAAGLAGYVAINLAAVLTALEFGIQPALFHDAQGTPLYAPYSLAVALPAMLIGHLTIAGFAEATLSAGIVRYLQNSEPTLLLQRSGDSPVGLQPLWVALGILIVVSPLGLLAAGTAWGEWGTEALAAKLPAGIPAGLERVASLWNAPVPDYAPSFLRSAHLGYVVSGGLGCLLTVGCIALLLRVHRRGEPDVHPPVQ